MTVSELKIPAFGSANSIPEIPDELYRTRLQLVLQRMREAKLDALLVYADREHSANLSYCSGFDPRFEEALLILTPDGQATLCLGNECINVVSRLPIAAKIELCQELSLMGQDRSKSWDLKPLLAKAGIHAGMRTGFAGWKTLMANRLEVPAYMVELVQEIAGTKPVNANDIFMHPQTGLRLQNEPEQIAHYEYASSRTSDSIFNILKALKPGARCFELARLFDDGGLPLSCHPMLACGATIPNGMASPGNNAVRQGEWLTTAFGIWGSLTCRAGLLASHPDQFATGVNHEAMKLIENYLKVTRAWYAALHVGVTAGEVWAAADGARDDSLYSFCVNPGHYIHLDEWTCSPFAKGSGMTLASSSAIQADIIPVSRKHSFSVNMEDGIVLADEKLRAQLQRQYPELMQRCQARRRFMIDDLGYALHEDVLPLSNLAGAYFPCLLDTRWVCRVRD